MKNFWRFTEKSDCYGECQQNNNIEGWGRLKRGFGQFVELRGGIGNKEWRGDFEGGGWYAMHTMLFFNVYFLNIFFSFFINRNLLFSFPFLFSDEISNIRNRIWPLKKQNRWSEIVCGTVRVIVVWLTSSEWVYLFVSCLKLILVSRFKSNWWAQQGIETQPNYDAPGNLLVELVILLR